MVFRAFFILKIVLLKDVSIYKITQPRRQINEIRVWSTGGMITSKGKPKLSKKSLSQYHFAHYKFHMRCPEIDLGLVRERLMCSQSFYVTPADGSRAETSTIVTILCSTLHF